MTTRQYKLIGDPLEANVAATVVFDGVEIFNGTFSGGPDEPEVAMITGSLDIVDPADGSNLVKSVSVTVSSGRALVGMFQWNYARIINPAYTPEQLAIIQDPASTLSQRHTIFEAVANPPFSSADLALIESTDPADDQIKRDLYVVHKCLPYIADDSVYAYGPIPDLNFTNRTNVLLNGVTPPEGNTNVPILMVAGDVLTFDTIVFATYAW